MWLRLCGCCLLLMGLCSCSRLTKAEEPENNLALTSLHFNSSVAEMIDDHISNIQEYEITKDNGEKEYVYMEGDEDKEIKTRGIKGQRRCSGNLCCPQALYCCSNLSCCKGKVKTPQKSC